MNLKQGIGLTTGLVALDQMIKWVIYRYFMDVEIKWLGDRVYFSPGFNKDISWISSKTGINFGVEVHICISIIAVIILILLGKQYFNKYAKMKYMVWAYWITLAGVICSAIDRIFWGTSLDYIFIKGYFVFDLKDVLINGMYVLGIGAIIQDVKDSEVKKV